MVPTTVKDVEYFTSQMVSHPYSGRLRKLNKDPSLYPEKGTEVFRLYHKFKSLNSFTLDQTIFLTSKQTNKNLPI